MPDVIRVTPEQLHGLSGQVLRGAADIDGLLGGLRAQVAPLADGVWAGQAAGQFQVLWEQWHRSARDLAGALDGIGRLLDGAATQYAQAEAGIAATFRA